VSFFFFLVVELAVELVVELVVPQPLPWQEQCPPA
jgi:hypothetical protein